MKKDELIKELKLVLISEGFYVAGSYALSKLGIDIKASDVDILLYKPTEQTLELIAKFQKEYPAKTKAFDYGDSELGGVFMKNDCKIDVFIVSSKPKFLELKDYNITTVDHVVNAKKSIGRPKDAIQLTKIAQSIYSARDLNSFIKNF